MAEHPSFSQLPPGEPIQGQTYRADGWAYHDMPQWATLENFEKILDIIGEGNYVVMAMTRKDNWVRGQFLISPRGYENIFTAQKALRNAAV